VAEVVFEWVELISRPIKIHDKSYFRHQNPYRNSVICCDPLVRKEAITRAFPSNSLTRDEVPSGTYNNCPTRFGYCTVTCCQILFLVYNLSSFIVNFVLRFLASWASAEEGQDGHLPLENWD